MLYQLEQGPAEQRIIRQCASDGLPLPDKIANAPKLRRGLGLYFDAFWSLDSCRQLGEVHGKIPWTAIQQYCETFSLDAEQAEDMHVFIRRMDAAYLDWVAKKRKRNEQR